MGTDLLVFALYGAVTVALAWVLAGYMHRVYAGERVILSPVLAPVERAFYAAAGTGPDRPQGWMAYALAVLAFHLAGFVLLFAILRLQGVTTWNPEGIPPMSPDLAFNTAISFVTNTNWQAYGGEGELSYFSQMVGLGVQNFVSAATGMAVAVAVIRGFARSRWKAPSRSSARARPRARSPSSSSAPMAAASSRSTRRTRWRTRRCCRTWRRASISC